jgi:CheY-like chemotaxis protein
MVRQVLTFARGFEGEKMMVQPEHLIDEMEKLATQSFPKNIELKTELPRGLNPILGDPTQIHQVLLNLCVNSRDAMPNGGIVRITAENIEIDKSYVSMNPEAKPGPHVLLKVIDNGSGMPPEVVERIFDPFFTTKEPGKGTGLGLSTLHAIVKGHGGFVQVHSEPGKGTDFQIYLPSVPMTAGEQIEDKQTVIPKGSGELVLVVDDEGLIREITRESLEEHGYRALIACDGTEALALFVEHKQDISVVIVDMMMPYMDGAATIRAMEKLCPSVKMVAVSGSVDKAKVAESASRRPIKFLPKPFTSEKLLTTLHSILHEN